MNDLVSWEAEPKSQDQDTSQVGVYTFYRNREQSQCAIKYKSKRNKKKSKSNISGRQMVKENSPRYQSKKKRSPKQKRKMKTKPSESSNIINISQNFLKNIFDRKKERSISKNKEKQDLKETIDLKVKEKIMEQSIEKQKNKGIEGSQNRYNALKRCRTSLESANSIDNEKQDKMKRMHTEVMINFSNLSIIENHTQPIKSPKVVNLNSQNNNILGADLIFQTKKHQKQINMPYLPEIRKPHIEKYLKIIQDKKNQHKNQYKNQQLTKSNGRSKSTLKPSRSTKIKSSISYTKVIESDYINRLKVIQLGRNAQNSLKSDWPEDKKAFLRKMGFKL